MKIRLDEFDDTDLIGKYIKCYEWLCQSCGTVHDRDDNASKNILRWGITSYHSNCKTTLQKVA